MTNRHPSWNRLIGFSPLLEARVCLRSRRSESSHGFLHSEKGLQVVETELRNQTVTRRLRAVPFIGSEEVWPLPAGLV